MEEFEPTNPQPAPDQPPAGNPSLPARELSGVKIPMLISGIFNCLVALSWFGTCFLFFVGIPLLVLGILEIITFTKLGGSREMQDMNRAKSKVFAILDVCSILLFNLPSMVCGIIQLVNHKQFDEQ